MDKVPAKKPATDISRTIEKRWGAPLTDAGWTAIPNVIIQRQRALGLSPLDVNILLQLLAYWWEPKNLPHPAKTTIAKAINVHPRTVQKRIAAMQAAKFIQRIERRYGDKGSGTNLYDFSGLIAATTPFALEELQEIEQRKAAKAAKLARKKPLLAVVKS